MSNTKIDKAAKFAAISTMLLGAVLLLWGISIIAHPILDYIGIFDAEDKSVMIIAAFLVAKIILFQYIQTRLKKSKKI